MKFFLILFFLTLVNCQKKDLELRTDNLQIKNQESYILIDSLIGNNERIKIVVNYDKIEIYTISNKRVYKSEVVNLPLRYSLFKWEGLMIKSEGLVISKNCFFMFNTNFAIISLEDDLGRGVFIPIIKDEVHYWNVLNKKSYKSFFVINHWPILIDSQKIEFAIVTQPFDVVNSSLNVEIYHLDSNHLVLHKTIKLPEDIDFSNEVNYHRIFKYLK